MEVDEDGAAVPPPRAARALVTIECASSLPRTVVPAQGSLSSGELVTRLPRRAAPPTTVTGVAPWAQPPSSSGMQVGPIGALAGQSPSWGAWRRRWRDAALGWARQPEGWRGRNPVSAGSGRRPRLRCRRQQSRASAHCHRRCPVGRQRPPWWSPARRCCRLRAATAHNHRGGALGSCKRRRQAFSRRPAHPCRGAAAAVRLCGAVCSGARGGC